jgi:hypothetical protein
VFVFLGPGVRQDTTIGVYKKDCGADQVAVMNHLTYIDRLFPYDLSSGFNSGDTGGEEKPRSNTAILMFMHTLTHVSKFLATFQHNEHPNFSKIPVKSTTYEASLA